MSEEVTVTKGQTLVRKCDGFVFRVKLVSKLKHGAYMQCVDATTVFGWFDMAAIQRDFTVRE